MIEVRTGACVTVKEAGLLVTPSLFARMVVPPTAEPVAKPEPSIEATAVLLEINEIETPVITLPN